MKSIFILLFSLFTLPLSANSGRDIVIEDAVVRAAVHQQRNSAAFMKITNNGKAAQLVYAKSPVSRSLELHAHINDQGVMRMRRIKQIDLPEKTSVTLQPGGLHIMLLGLKRELKPGSSVSLTLGFADGSEKPLQIPVRRMMRHKNNMSKPN